MEAFSIIEKKSLKKTYKNTLQVAGSDKRIRNHQNNRRYRDDQADKSLSSKFQAKQTQQIRANSNKFFKIQSEVNGLTAFSIYRNFRKIFKIILIKITKASQISITL